MKDLDQEKADLNALIREAHEAIRDLRTAQKNLDDTIAEADRAREAFAAEIAGFTSEVVLDHVGKELTKATEAIPDAIHAYIKGAEESIMKRFDRLAEVLIGSTEEVASKVHEAAARHKIDSVLQDNDWLFKKKE